MADRIHVRSTPRPSSIPPNTADVDAGWPYVEPHELWLGMPALPLGVAALEAFAETPIAPLVAEPPPVDEEAPVEAATAETPRVSVEALVALLVAEQTPVSPAVEDDPTKPLFVAPPPLPSVLEAPVEAVFVAPPPPPVVEVPKPLFVAPSPLPVLDAPGVPDSQGPSTSTPLPRPFAYALSGRRGRSKAWLAAPLVLLAAWFMLRRPRAPEVAAPLPPPKSEIHAARDLTPVGLKVPAPQVPVAAAPAPAPRDLKPAPLARKEVEKPTTPASLASKETAKTVDVKVVVVPPEAELYRRGKFVGKSGTVLKLNPGDLRFYDVVLPGYSTQELRVDGRHPQLRVNLKPQSPPSP